MRGENLCIGAVQLSDVIVIFFPEFGTTFLQGNTRKVKMEVTLTRLDYFHVSGFEQLHKESISHEVE